MKIKDTIIYLLLLSIATHLNANQDASESKDSLERIHSVRQVIDEGSKVEQKDVSAVDAFKGMFSDAKVVGQIRSISAGYSHKQKGVSDTYATALGGALKYELASLNGFNAAFGVLVSNDIAWASGEKQKHNDELSSSTGDYVSASEAYVNYKYEGLNIRAGRQLIDTPLADSDDIRMIANTFEGYVATYDVEEYSFFGAKIQKWQGVDASLDEGWQKLGKNGVDIIGLSYATKYTYFNTWYYSISGLTNAIYLDGGIDFDLAKDLFIHADLQYISESELEGSGVSATIYGAFAEVILDKLSVNIAYNKAHEHKNKESFSGIGGGSLYTSMDTMIIDEIAKDRDAQAYVMGMVYTFEKLNMLYAVGNFKGEKNSLGKKQDLLEQDMGFEYNYDEDFTLTGLYVISRDLQNTAKTSFDWDRFQMMFTYQF